MSEYCELMIARQTQATATPTGYAVVDRDLRFVEINETLAAMNGRSVANHLGQTVAEVLPRLALAIEPLLRQVLASGEPITDVEIAGERPTGIGQQGRWLTSYHPVRARSGCVLGIEMVVQELPLQQNVREQAEWRTTEATEHRLAFLLEAISTLVQSLDYRTTLRHLVELAVPRLADICGVYIVEPGSQEATVQYAYADPAHAALLQELSQSYPPNLDAPRTRFERAMQMGTTQCVPMIDDAWLRSLAVDEHHLHLLRRLKLCSALVVPLQPSEQVRGMLVFTMANSGRHYSKDDLALAEELVRRATVAIAQSRRYEATQVRLQRTDEDLALLDMLLASAPIGLAFVDREFRYVRINNYLAAMNTLPVADHLGRRVRDLFPRQAPVWEAHWQQVLETGEPVVDVRLQGLVGEVMHTALVSYYPVRASDGEIVGVGVIVQNITEQQRIEKSLQQANERLNMALEALDGFIYDYDLTTGLVERSSGFAKVTGYRPEEAPVTAEWWMEQVHPDDRAWYLQEAERVLAMAERSAMEYRIRHKDGFYVTVWDWSQLRRDEQGRVIRITGTTLNVTARRRDEERQRLLVEASKLLTSSFDYAETLQTVARLAVPGLADYCTVRLLEPDGQVQTVAIAHRDPYKQSLLETLNERYQPALDEPQSLVGSVLGSGQSLVLTQLPEDYVDTLPMPDSLKAIVRQLAPRSLIIVPLAARGQVHGALTLVAAESNRCYDADDLTMAEELGRRAAAAIENARLYRAMQQTLQEHEQTVALLDTLLTTAPVGMSFMDTDLRFQRINERLAEINGIPVQDHIGRTGAELFANLIDVVYPLLHQVLATGEPIPNVEVSGETPAAPGVTRHWLAGYYPVHTPDGRILGIGAVVTEITEQKRAEEERSRLYVAEQQARATAEAAVRMRDMFLSIAAHELKNPLTTILGQSQLLQRRMQQEGKLNERDERALQAITEQTRRLNKMVSDLLDFSRIEQGQLQIARFPLDLGALMQRIVDEVQPTLQNHTVSCVVAESPLVIAGDSIRLEQVLQNLIGNAIKYSPDGGMVQVQVERRDIFACVSITDEGIGIPPDAFPQLFEPFYRAANAETRNVKGVGVGLYVVKQIVTLHGGRVEVTSVEGEGSTFTVCLPLAE